MPRVVFAPHLRRHVDQPPGLRDYVLDEQGMLRRHVIVFVNARRVADREGLSDALADTDEVHVFQALTGG